MAELAPVFVNDRRVFLRGDPKPEIRKIIRMAGREPERVRVFRLTGRGDRQGMPVKLDETLDRKRRDTPIRLRVLEPTSPGDGGPYEEATPTGELGPGVPAEAPNPSPTLDREVAVKGEEGEPYRGEARDTGPRPGGPEGERAKRRPPTS